MKVLMLPHVYSFGNDESGIRRVVEAYFRHLPDYGIELVDPDATSYDLKVVHAGITGSDCDVCHCHGLYWTADYTAPKWEYRTNARVIDAIRHAREVTVPSWWVAETFQRDMRFTPHVVPHGIDIEEWGSVGRHDGYVLWNKNRVGDVCSPEAVNVLAGLFEDINFVSTFALPGYTDNVTVTGVVPHTVMKGYLQNAMLYLSTTKETFGIGILEAIACGIPVLGWAHGGNMEIIRHKETGYMATPGDYDDLADGLVYCMQHRDRLSDAALESARDWAWEYAIGKVVGVYEQAVAAEPPTVSIVIPYYNKSREKLEMAVRSAVDQDRYVGSVVIVDDGSDMPDMVDEVAVAYGIDVIHQSNGGVARARNAGIAAHDTKYVCCLDSDDAIEPTFVRKCVDALEADRSLGIAYTGLLLRGIGNDGIPYYNQGTWPQQFNFDLQLEGKNQVPTCCVYRRKMWERLGGYNPRYCPDGAGVEDAEFWLRCGAAGWGAKKITEEPLFVYSWGGSTQKAGYSAVDWTSLHPWTKNGQHPFASVATPAYYSHGVKQYDQPAVSVIIPVGPGHEIEVENALEGLDSQTFSNWEAILVWDTASDKNLDRLKTAYPYVIVVETGGSAGAGAARNMGVEYARAGFLLFNDADDWLYPTALERMLEEYKQNEGIIYSDYDGKAIISDESKLDPSLRARIRAKDKEYTILGYLAKEYDCERAQRQPESDTPYIWCNVTCLVPTAWHYEIGGFDEGMESWEDVDYHWRMARHGKCYYRIPESLMMYRFTTGNRREDGHSVRAETVGYIREKYRQEGDVKMACKGCGRPARPNSMERAALITGNRTVPISAVQGGAPVNQIQLPLSIGGVITVTEGDMVMARYNSRMPTDHKVTGPNTMILYGYHHDGDVFRVHKNDLNTGKFTEVVKHTAVITPPMPPRVPARFREEGMAPAQQPVEQPKPALPKDEPVVVPEPKQLPEQSKPIGITDMSAADIRAIVKQPTITGMQLRTMYTEEKENKKRAYILRLLEIELQRWE